jgi:hypothetical protein
VTSTHERVAGDGTPAFDRATTLLPRGAAFRTVRRLSPAVRVQPPRARWIDVPVSRTNSLTASCLADAALWAYRFCAARARSRAD